MASPEAAGKVPLALHTRLPSQEAASLAGALPTCQPLGSSEDAQDQPGVERHLGHSSPARERLPRSPQTAPCLKREQFAAAASLAASGPSSLSWNGSIFLCFCLQSWEGLAVQLADPKGYFPSYFGNLQDFVVKFLAELFRIIFKGLIFHCSLL